ncbi:MAG: DNA-directed RNA polymerase subunit delta [Solobacterium sp.]|nr:DNA-directed RNA polymerase subunit delta [Solobacterium sp.]MBR2668198.1 DNA-directed RNA polymerase subunit delta [Solobacterium sp.]
MSSMKESMTDVAYHCLSEQKKEIEFSRLWVEVCNTMNIPENHRNRKKAEFYSELMMDGRFASLKGNKWDLRDRRRFDEVHTEIEEIDDDEDLLENEEEDEDNPLPREEDEY